MRRKEFLENVAVPLLGIADSCGNVYCLSVLCGKRCV